MASGRGRKTSTNERVLTLFFELLGAEVPRTKAQLAKLPGYSELGSPAAFETQFQRDKDALRAVGIPLQMVGGARSEAYRIDPAEVTGREPGIEPADVGLVLLAAGAWADTDQVDDQRLQVKIKARGDAKGAESDAIGAARAKLALEGADVVADVALAIARRQPITFEYASTRDTAERSVAPWTLEARAGALYLWGWDLDRRAPRLYRLSRVRGSVELLGQPGDAEIPDEPAHGDPFADRLTAPLLRVRPGAAARIRQMSRSVEKHSAEDESESGDAGPVGWDLMEGQPEDHNRWLSAVLADASDVVVLEPSDLREAALSRLRAAAALAKAPGTAAGSDARQGEGNDA